jgi:hypothetical protein
MLPLFIRKRTIKCPDSLHSFKPVTISIVILGVNKLLKFFAENKTGGNPTAELRIWLAGRFRSPSIAINFSACHPE